ASRENPIKNQNGRGTIAGAPSVFGVCLILLFIFRSLFGKILIRSRSWRISLTESGSQSVLAVLASRLYPHRLRLNVVNPGGFLDRFSTVDLTFVSQLRLHVRLRYALSSFITL